MNAKVLYKGPCVRCPSSDAYFTYDDGHSYCFSCATFFPSKEGLNHKDMTEILDLTKINSGSITVTNPGFISNIVERNISRDSCEKYGVRIIQNEDGLTTHHVYPYHNSNGIHVANKIRECATKGFQSEPRGALGLAVLFGEHLCKPGKYITVCEGELDCLAAYEMLGSKWPVVSIKNGVAGAVKDCKTSFDFLNSYETVVICFDSDDPGKKGAQKVAELFEPNKCRIVNLSLKDPCEYLMEGKRKEFVDAWWSARTYTPAGILNLKDYGEALYNEEQQQTCLYPYSGLNEYLFGIRTGELVTITAGTGTGKSSFIRELMHHVLKNTKENIGVIALEENVRQTIFHLMSVEANARLYIREIREGFPKNDMLKWQEATVGSGRFFAFDHFGSVETNEILNKVRYMVKALDCKWIFLDHLSILVSGLEGMDERRNIDELMTKLRSLTEETKCALMLVSHLRRPSGNDGHEEGKEVSLSHLRGSHSIAQLSDAVIALERDQQSDDPTLANITTVRVLKNRYAGNSGVACHLRFNKETGRLLEANDLNTTEEEATL